MKGVTALFELCDVQKREDPVALPFGQSPFDLQVIPDRQHFYLLGVVSENEKNRTLSRL